MTRRDRAWEWWYYRREDARDKRRGSTETPHFSGLRWWYAERLNRDPNRCWSMLAEFTLGWDNWPSKQDTERCRESALECGSCYCGKVARADVFDEMIEAGSTPSVRVPMPAEERA